MSEHVIEIRGLEKSYRKFHLGPLDLSVPQGSIYGLIGPNGAGKTTTFDLIMGMGKEQAGSITVFGKDHRAEEVAIKRRIGYASPDLSYKSWGKVGRVIHFVRRFYPSWDQSYCDTLLERWNIGWGEQIAAMSFGTAIKLSLIVALSHRPDLLLLDEPTLGVDAATKQDIFEELLSVVRDGDRTVLISSHGLTDIERFADRVGIIYQGQLVMDGVPSDLSRRFSFVDYEMPHNGLDVNTIDGASLVEPGEGRARVLIDGDSRARERMSAGGAKEIASVAPSLEDLFIGLTKRRSS